MEFRKIILGNAIKEFLEKFKTGSNGNGGIATAGPLPRS